MTPTAALIAAVLRVCSTADPYQVRIIHTLTATSCAATERRRIEVPVEIALSVAIEESGVRRKTKRRQHDNVMGLGPAALRLAGSHFNARTKYALEMLERLRVSTGSWRRALAVYHRGKTDSAEGLRYADRVLRLARKIRRLARQHEVNL